MIAVCVKPRFVQRLADAADAAVHHVGRRDDVGAGGGVRERRAHELLDASESLATSSSTTMPQWPCDVYSHRQTSVTTSRPGHLALDRADRRLHRRLGIVRRRSDGVLLVRQAEEQHAGMPSALIAAASRTASSTDS